VIVTRSDATYAATVDRLVDAVEQRGLTVFARIDHAGAARHAGLKLASEEVILVGNPQAGTPLMQSDPRVGIELPLRLLVWEDDQGTLVGYRDPRELSQTYDLAAHESTLTRMAQLLEELAGVAAR
jgi:uncharacterized protein (DUF302 family)